MVHLQPEDEWYTSQQIHFSYDHCECLLYGTDCSLYMLFEVEDISEQHILRQFLQYLYLIIEQNTALSRIQKRNLEGKEKV